jgi:uncharacterized protein (UPF0332 family)
MMQHVFQLWIMPEIRRRGQLPGANGPIVLRAAQVILFPDARPVQVRLNDEVRAIVTAEWKPGVTKRLGDPVYAHEVAAVRHLQAQGQEDTDCGHLTVLLSGGQWLCSFDFRYNRQMASKLLSAAEEFLASASESRLAGRIHPAIDNLYSAAELAAKAEVVAAFPRESDARSHKQVQNRFNMLCRDGNIDADQGKTFNGLVEARLRARYVEKAVTQTMEQVEEWEAQVKALLNDGRARNQSP